MQFQPLHHHVHVLPFTWKVSRGVKPEIKACQRSYRDLASFDFDFHWKEFKHNILPNWSDNFNNYWHIGLRINSPGNYTWVNGSPMPINHWQPGQPYPNATFAAMASYPPDISGSFKSITNDNVAGFICQGIRRECNLFCYLKE